MPINKETVSLDNLGGGAVLEKFDVELERILKNIDDINTGLENRVLTIKVSFKPNETRNVISTTVEVSSKLASDKSFETSLVVDNEGSRLVAREFTAEQMTFDFENVHKIKKGNQNA